MLLQKAHVTFFKSIDDSGEITLDQDVTVLVGQNESGKTAFLKALHKASPIEDDVSYDIIEDYPRKWLNDYEQRHEDNPATVVTLEYSLDNDEIHEINKDLGFDLVQILSFGVHYKYGGTKSISLDLPEHLYVEYLVNHSSLSTDTKKELSSLPTIKELIERLNSLDLNSEERDFLDELNKRFSDTTSNWDCLDYYVWKNYISPNIPKFVYFDDYKLLPGKVNLTLLQQKVQQSISNPNILTDEERTVLAFFRLANVDLEDLVNPQGYENSKARLEAISNSVSDKIFQFWTQNRNLEVLIDIKPDSKDVPPFNTGNNLYIRIRNSRHRVSVPFDQRSRGFIWFFSFIVWFDSIQQERETKTDLILLLDEPGLSLHALGQKDLLNYIDILAQNHQIIYTTHSPFMIHSDRLFQVRTVEDKLLEGTKVTDNVSSSDPNTLFPLQAALGYTIAQNLFISKRNLLVEGPADLIYLQYFSSLLERDGRHHMREDITIVPVGGLDKLATFIALLGGNELEISVLHDLDGKPDQRLQSLVNQKIIQEGRVLNYGIFRNLSATKKSKNDPSSHDPSSDIEDMISPNLYITIMNKAYHKELNGTAISETDLPTGDRITIRIEQYLEQNDIKLRPSGGFNHYLVANYLMSHPITSKDIDSETLKRFENIFSAVNSLYS